MMTIDELLIDFVEMGFVPKTFCEILDDYGRGGERHKRVYNGHRRR